MYTYPKPLEQENIAFNAVDTGEELLRVWYIGPYKFAKVTVSSGDIVLKADDTDGATTTALTCDVSEAGYDTLGECVDAINALNYAGWYACLVGGLRDDIATSALVARSATSCWRTEVPLYHDTSTALVTSKYQITTGVNNCGIGRDNAGRQIHLLSYSITTTGTKSGNVIQVFDCDDAAKTSVKVRSVASGASTAAKAEDQSDFGETPLVIPEGHRLVIREENANALTGPIVRVTYRPVLVSPPGPSNTLGQTSRM